MKSRKLITIFAVAVLSLGVLQGFAGCAQNTASDANSASNTAIGSGQEIAAVNTSDVSGGVAAKVNDVEIGENAVTAYINNIRYGNELQSDEDWGQWLYDNGYSIDSFRADIVNYFVNQELVRQACDQQGIAVSDEEVNQAFDSAKGDTSDADFKQELESDGMTEDMYKASLKISLLTSKLSDAVVGDVVSDEDLLNYVKICYPDDIAEDATSLDGVDEEKVQKCRETLESLKTSYALSDWMSEFKKSCDVTTEVRPDGLPWVVDLAPYEEAAAQAGDNASDDASADEEAEGDAANESEEG